MGKVTNAVKAVFDMSTKARMARAKEQGFDTSSPQYHGTTADFDRFEIPEEGFSMSGKGVYLTDDMGKLERFAKGEGANVIPTYTAGDIATNSDANQVIAELGTNLKGGHRKEMELINDGLKAKGFTGVNRGGETLVFDPSNIRSVNAQFDPAKSSSSNLLASGLAGTAAGMGALYTPEENQAQAGMLGMQDIQMGPEYGSIQPDEWPMLHGAADTIDKYTNTPIGPLFEGTTNYMRNFGTERDSWKRYQDAAGAALDFL